jgi:predicted regulator of Ras-like GTPase activity (Roadblock/LC7/MglB family)
MPQADATGQLGWLLDTLARRVAGVRHAIILSRDGLVIASSAGLDHAEGEHLSALAAGVQSLARGTGEQFGGGPVRQTIIEMEHALLFVMAAGAGTCLAVLTSADASIGVLAYEMAMLVRRMGRHLTAAPRSRDHQTTTG